MHMRSSPIERHSQATKTLAAHLHALVVGGLTESPAHIAGRAIALAIALARPPWPGWM